MLKGFGYLRGYYNGGLDEHDLMQKGHGPTRVLHWKLRYIRNAPYCNGMSSLPACQIFAAPKFWGKRLLSRPKRLTWATERRYKGNSYAALSLDNFRAD